MASRLSSALMDEIRERVAARMKERGISANALSGRLNRGSTYVFDWLSGKKDQIPYEMKRAIARELNMSLHDIGISEVEHVRTASAGGLSEYAEPYTPGPNSLLSQPPHIAYFRMKDRALDQHEDPIYPGDLLAFDINQTDPAKIDTGKVVVAQLYDRRELLKSHGSIIRVYVAPNKLITNSSSDNEIMRLDDPALPFVIAIKGTLRYIAREVN